MAIRVFICLLFCCSVVWAGDALRDLKQTQKELTNLRHQIKTTTKKLRQVSSRSDKLHEELKGIETRLAALHRDIKKNERDIKRLEGELLQLDQDRRRNQIHLRKHQSLLTKQLRASLILGQQSSLKFMLNQEDPNSLGRNLYIFQRLNNRRARKVNDLRSQLVELDDIEIKISKNKQLLKRSRAHNAKTQQQLQNTLRGRRMLLAKLQKERKQHDQRLKRLQADEDRLLALLNEIKSHIPKIDLDNKTFAQRKGKLLWPLKQRRPHALPKLQGIMIPAAQGSGVQAVAPGQVIFAEWLRAYGLLLIVNHGHGYLSLYGFNQQLHKNIGDWVTTGEVIASTGNTGGQHESGLYFELRKDTKVLDLHPWMEKKFSMINK